MTPTFESGGLRFRPVGLTDAGLVAFWRNLPENRAAFFDPSPVTASKHIRFVLNKPDNDLVWMVNDMSDGQAVGMASMTIDHRRRVAEYGRLCIDPGQRGRGLAYHIEMACIWFVFERLNLRGIWCDVLADNEAVLNLHRKTGWLHPTAAAIDHIDPYGDRPVVTLEYDRFQWVGHRPLYYQLIGEQMGEWKP